MCPILICWGWEKSGQPAVNSSHGLHRRGALDQLGQLSYYLISGEGEIRPASQARPSQPISVPSLDSDSYQMLTKRFCRDHLYLLDLRWNFKRRLSVRVELGRGDFILFLFLFCFSFSSFLSFFLLSCRLIFYPIENTNICEYYHLFDPECLEVNQSTIFGVSFYQKNKIFYFRKYGIIHLAMLQMKIRQSWTMYQKQTWSLIFRLQVWDMFKHEHDGLCDKPRRDITFWKRWFATTFLVNLFKLILEAKQLNCIQTLYRIWRNLNLHISAIKQVTRIGVSRNITTMINILKYVLNMK